MKTFLDNRVKEYLLPISIVYSTDNVENAKKMLEEYTESNIMGMSNPCSIKGKGSFVLDFGQEYFGGVRIFTNSNNTSCCGNPCIRIRFGESLSECFAEIGEKNAGNDHSTRDMSVYMSSNADMEFGSTGYRYIRIESICDGEISFNNVFGTFIHHNEQSEVFIETDDVLVNDILKAAERTVYLNVQNYLWDGIKRDQHVWVGDLYPEVLGCFSMFTDTTVIDKSLNLILDNYALPRWFNDIPSYNAWFVMICCLYYKRQGILPQRFVAATDKIINQFNDCMNADGTFNYYKLPLNFWDVDFFDWSSFGTDDSRAGVHYLLYYALKQVETLPCFEEKTRKLAKEMLKKLDLQTFETSSFKAIEALGILCDKADGEKSLEFITNNGSKGYSSFLSYLTSKALADNGKVQAAFDNMVEYYGAMIKLGATTLFEAFDLTWAENACRIDELPKGGQRDFHGDNGSECYQGYRCSLCHGWSCGFLPFFIDYVIGFTYDDEACSKISFNPNMCGLKHIKGRFVTTKGVVEVELFDENGQVKTFWKLV